MKTIEEKINKIFIKYTEKDFVSNAKLQDVKLMGGELGIPPRTLVHIYCEMEEEFNLTILQEAVIDGKFDTFRNICKAVRAE